MGRLGSRPGPFWETQGGELKKDGEGMAKGRRQIWAHGSFFLSQIALVARYRRIVKIMENHMIFNDFCLPGPVWRRLRDHLDRLGGVPEPIWVGVPSWSSLGAPLGAHLGHFGFVLGPSEAHLSSPEALLGPYWGHLGPSWDRPRTILGCLGAI